MRRLLQIGAVRLRAAAAVLVLTTTAIGALGALEVQLVVITAMLAVMLVLEWREFLSADSVGHPARRVSNSGAPATGPELR